VHTSSDISEFRLKSKSPGLHPCNIAGTFIIPSMPDQKPRLEDEKSTKRVRFLEKLNPKATPWTVARSAMLYGAVAAVFILIVKRFNPSWQDLHWLAFVGLVLLGAGVGAIHEWQWED
jgi:hypothetical protein